MAKFPTFPTLYDEVLQISISKLKEWGYLKHGQIKSGTITWSRNGNQISRISIQVNTQSDQPYIELDYKCNETPINYKVQLVSILSNLGIGIVWFFVCPSSGKHCRKLYLIDTYFLHREAFKGCMYDSQTHSKYYRSLDNTLGVYFKTDKLYEQLYKKHFKKKYAGKPTKRYLKLTQQIQKAENISYHEVKSLFKN